ncbi:MAG: acyltransferase family protein [Chitinivibrionales bacterium]
MLNSEGTTMPKKQYFHSIDGLRLIASVNIVLFHLVKIGGLYDMRGKPGWLFTILKGPAFHASMFFILAGFIFTVKYAPYARSFSTLTLVKNRLKDLYPLHALTVFAMIPFVVMPWIQGQGQAAFGKLSLSAIMHLTLTWSFYPLNTYSFNTPSWALSAFFLCYLLFGPTLRIVSSIKKRKTILFALAATMMPSIIWSVLYANIGKDGQYYFFHMFAPVRFFEFALGMCLAQLYTLNNSARKATISKIGARGNDALIVLCVSLIILNLRIGQIHGGITNWVTYHVIMLPLYAVLLYRFARGNGAIAKLFSLPFIQELGKSSFYPYLLHIPLISWTCAILENSLNYRTFLHSPVNICLFLVFLYGIGYMLRRLDPRRKRSTYRPPAKQIEDTEPVRA